jgi:hypothetical protein
MPEITTEADAKHAVAMSCRYNARDFEPITGGDGQSLGWTFATGRSGSYGWVLADGRISHATEWTRGDAATCARDTHARPHAF